MMQSYLIYHGVERGNREDCNVFHEEPEVYLDEAIAQERKAVLETHYNQIPDGWVYLKVKVVGAEESLRS